MKMLAHNPKKRLTIQDVLAHPWMSDREKVHRTHLPETVESLKVFNSKRKLKASVQSIAGGITADSMFGTDTDISKYLLKFIHQLFQNQTVIVITSNVYQLLKRFQICILKFTKKYVFLFE